MKRNLIEKAKKALFNFGIPMELNKTANLKVRKIRLNGKIAGKIQCKNLVVYVDNNTLQELLEGGIR